MINTNSISFLQSYSRLIVCTVNDSTSSFICILVKQSITSYLLFCPEINFINQILPLQISKSSAPHLTILFHTLALSSKFLSFSYSYSPRDGGSKKKQKCKICNFVSFQTPAILGADELWSSDLVSTHKIGKYGKNWVQKSHCVTLYQ